MTITGLPERARVGLMLPRDHGVVPGVIERAEEGRYSTNSVANQVSSSAATFLAEPEVWRAMSSM